MKLRGHLVLLVMVTVVPVVLFAAALIAYNAHLQREFAARGIRDLARALALALDRDIRDIKAAVRTLAASRHLDDRPDLRRFYDEATTVSKSFGGWTVLSHPSGRQLVDTSRPFGDPLPVPTASSLEMTRSVAADRQPFVSNVFIGTVSRRPAVIVALPVVRDDQVRYVIDFPFEPARFTRLLQEMALSPQWIAVITDRAGGVVARVPDADAFVGRPAKPLWVETTASSDEGFLRGRVLSEADAYVGYKRSRESGWMVAVGAPVVLIDGPSRRSLLLLSAGGAVLAAVALALAFVFDKRIAGLLAREEAERGAERERVARAQAEAANRAKDDFLAMLSHELRTPLNAIVGWVRLLRAGMLDAAKTAHALEVIERNVDQQGRLITDLLDVSRIVMGSLKVEMAMVDFPALVATAVDSARPAAAAKKISLTSELDGHAAPVRGDPGRLQQVVENLLSNAVKFTPDGGSVMVRLVGNGEACLTVADTGQGIGREFLPHVFERFRQADAPGKAMNAGLGLGLTVVRQLVELHGGHVRAESAGEGRGATFTVTLPLVTRG